MIIAFFFSFIQTRPYSVRHSTVYTNDNTLEIELYIVTNRFFVIHPDQYCKEIIQKHRRINKLSADTTYQIVLFANSWCFKKGYSCAEYYKKHKPPFFNKQRLVLLYWNIKKRQKSNRFLSLTPRVGFEPTTLRLTAECSTTELSRNTYIV